MTLQWTKTRVRQTNLLFYANVHSAFVKYENRTFNTSFAYLVSFVLYILHHSSDPAVIPIALRFPSSSLYFYLMLVSIRLSIPTTYCLSVRISSWCHTCLLLKRKSLLRSFCSPCRFLFCRSLYHASRRNVESISALTSIAISTCRATLIQCPPSTQEFPCLLPVDCDCYTQRRLTRPLQHYLK